MLADLKVAYLVVQTAGRRAALLAESKVVQWDLPWAETWGSSAVKMADPKVAVRVARKVGVRAASSAVPMVVQTAVSWVDRWVA